MLPLKPLSPSAIPAALAKAERYRLLNEPEQAVSICEDVLRADPQNADARVTLILALTDTFPHGDGKVAGHALELVARLPTEYERAYYAGLVAERRARAVLERGCRGCGLPAGDHLREAMRLYELAEAARPADNDDALLRWNACARLLDAHPEMEPAEPEPPSPLMLE